MNLVNIGQIYYPGDLERWNTLGGISITSSNNINALLRLSGVTQQIAQIFQIPPTASGKVINSVRYRFANVAQTGDVFCKIVSLDSTFTPTLLLYGGSNSGVLFGNALVSNSGNQFTFTNGATGVPGDMVAVVLGMSVSGADIQVNNAQGVTLALPCSKSWNAQTAVWSSPLNLANESIAISCTDGTYLNLNAGITDGADTVSYNSGSLYNEFAIKFNPPFNCRVIGGWWLTSYVGSATGALTLYQDTTSLAVSRKTSLSTTLNLRLQNLYFDAPIVLSTGNNYYLAVTPFNSSNVGLWQYTVPSGAFNAYDRLNGTNLAQRSGLPYSWDSTTYQFHYPALGVIIDQIDTGGSTIAGIATMSNPAPFGGHSPFFQSSVNA